MNVRDEIAAGPVRGRPRRHGRAGLLVPVPAARRTGGAGGTLRAAKRLGTAARAPRGWPRRPWWSAFPVSALLILLFCWGPTVDAARDPMVEAVQEALAERGFEPGRIDGAMGSRTRKALREFQRSVGLPATGEIDAATVAALGLGPPDAGGAPPAAARPRPARPAAPATKATGAAHRPAGRSHAG